MDSGKFYEMKSYIHLISSIFKTIMKSDFTAFCKSLYAVNAWMANANVCFYEINSVSRVLFIVRYLLT